MVVLLPLFLLALTVKEDHAPLRSGCAPDADVVATLPEGATLTLRYAMAGESVPCYKVAAEANGRTVEGYLFADAIAGLDDFEKGRRDAAWLETVQVMKQLPSLAKGADAQGVANQAMQLIQASQPSKALALLEPELHKKPDAGLLAVAGY